MQKTIGLALFLKLIGTYELRNWDPTFYEIGTLGTGQPKWGPNSSICVNRCQNQICHKGNTEIVPMILDTNYEGKSSSQADL